MKPIDDYDCISSEAPSLFFWQGYDPSLKYVVSCSAIVTLAGLLLIDPLPLAEEPLAALVQEEGAAPAAIVLTSGNHQRHSLFFAKKYSIPIYAPAGAGEEIVADVWYQPGSDFLGLKSVALPGFGPGETALLDSTGKVLILGDALTNADGEGLLLLPKKYCENYAAAKKSLRALQEFSPTMLLTAHGLPIVTDASERLEHFKQSYSHEKMADEFC